MLRSGLLVLSTPLRMPWDLQEDYHYGCERLQLYLLTESAIGSLIWRCAIDLQCDKLLNSISRSESESFKLRGGIMIFMGLKIDNIIDQFRRDFMFIEVGIGFLCLVWSVPSVRHFPPTNCRETKINIEVPLQTGPVIISTVTETSSYRTSALSIVRQKRRFRWLLSLMNQMLSWPWCSSFTNFYCKCNNVLMM